MLPKPPECRGCPLYGNGQGFVPDTVVEGSQVAICGQNPGEYEEEGNKIVGGYSGNWQTVKVHPQPYIGPTGYMMDREFLPLAKVEREQVTVMNAIRCRWQGGNELPELNSHVTRQAIEHCTHHHQKLPKSVKLIVAEGGYALLALTGEGIQKERTVESWRGYLLPYNPLHRPTLHHSNIYHPGVSERSVLATYHLSYLFRAPWDRPSAYRDWSKIPLTLSGKWPEHLPKLIRNPPVSWPQLSAFDTEWDMRTGILTRYSMAHEIDGAPSVYVIEAENAGFVPVQAGSHVILQNAMADLADMNKVFGGVEVNWDDTMLAHSVLWPDMAHDLNYLGSIYARINRWKHLQWTNPWVYAGADALGTLDVWNRGLAGELARDPGSRKVYLEYVRPLVGIILRARSKGIKPNQERVKAVLDLFGKEMEDAQAMATASVGWPLNIGSPDQVMKQLYEREKIHINPISGKLLR